MSFFEELKRRNVIRMAGVYLVSAWMIVQVAETLMPAFDIPGWVLRAIIIVLGLAFLPALAFSWVFEMTPHGLRRESAIAREESITLHTGKRLNRLFIVMLILAVLYLGFDKFVLAPARDATRIAASLTTLPVQEAETSDPSINPKSIAVLPFSDLSPGHDQEYFSDGMSEEILNALAQIQDLKVAGRTSSFHFKGKNDDLRAIAATLGVAHILEGSVRKQGDKVRITAQLIQASDGFHMWSETYDGDLSDVFELQERIARAITENLKIVLQGDQKSRLVHQPTNNTAAYALYWQAAVPFNQRDASGFPLAVEQLQEAIRLDPAFARAHARLASLYAISPAYDAGISEDPAADAQREAQLAIELDPTLAEPYAALGLVYGGQREGAKAREAFEKATSLDPNDITTNLWLGADQYKTGYLKRSGTSLDKVLEVDPMLPVALLWRGFVEVQAGNWKEAESHFRRADDTGLVHAGVGLSLVAAERGDTAEALRQLARGLQPFTHELPEGSAQVLAEGIMGDAAARGKAVEVVDAYLATRPKLVAGIAPYALARLGHPERALALAGEKPTSNDPLLLSMIWSPTGRNTRVIPEFSDFARETGLAATWDKFGPPDLCSKNEQGDYVCE
ncbi:hypothetical protein [Dokdonella sp.]|uniref:tetratricopeptide repeat protein n=1 Tax=Dokdonella sp. TaxID=2291710 RepID=UPI0035284D24